MTEPFLLRALIASLAVAIVAAPLGCFVVWRRMAYFGDATAHASILGVALALAFGVAPRLGILVVALAVGVLVFLLLGRGTAADTVWTCDFSHEYVTINADYRS